jgi:uncharacterized membrane protein YphA (DoxX/SURF4 family)
LRRLYSTFPGGFPAVGLLLLRGTIGVHLLMRASACAIELHDLRFAWIFVAMGLVAGAALVLGLLTPVMAALSALACFANLFWHSMPGADLFAGNLSTFNFVLIALAIVLLGPGAVSLDAHFFGRRKIIIPRATNPDHLLGLPRCSTGNIRK